jgi:hypothetical protein
MHIKSLLRFLSGRTVYQTVPMYNLKWVRSKKLFRELLGDSIITLVDVGAGRPIGKGYQVCDCS